MLSIYIDENKERVDYKTWKISICAVEFDDGSLDRDLKKLKDLVDSDPIRFPRNDYKLHFSALNDAQKKQIIEIIAKLPFIARVYTYYSISKDPVGPVVGAMTSTVQDLRRLHSKKDIEITIEEANEYKANELKGLLEKDLVEFLLPDAILNVYCKRLNELNPRSNSANMQFFKLIQNKIRLQVFKMQGHSEHNARQERL